MRASKLMKTLARCGLLILHDSKTGVNYAASDPRTDGEAVPEPILK